MTALDPAASGSRLRWDHLGTRMEAAFDRPIRKCLALSDGSGILVIFEPAGEGEKNTALLLGADGAPRGELAIPPEAGPYLSIWDAYYEGGELAVILTTRGTYDVACIFDDGGNYLRRHFTK